MNFSDTTYTQAVANAKHYLAVGQTDIWLGSATEKNFASFPWNEVTKIDGGGSHRLDMATSLWFLAKHASGIIPRWSVDLEDRSASGKGYYEINTALIEKIFPELPLQAQKEFSAILRKDAALLLKNAREYEEIAEKEKASAAIFKKLAESVAYHVA